MSAVLKVNVDERVPDALRQLGDRAGMRPGQVVTFLAMQALKYAEARDPGPWVGVMEADSIQLGFARTENAKLRERVAYLEGRLEQVRAWAEVGQ